MLDIALAIGFLVLVILVEECCETRGRYPRAEW